MITPNYVNALNLVEQLSPEDQQQLLAELTARIQQQVTPKHSVLEFRGVGKTNPIGMDAQVFVYQERASWNG